MNWSLPQYTAPLNGEEIFTELCRHNGLLVELVDKSSQDEGNAMASPSAMEWYRAMSSPAM